jgi:type I restriction enzyme S subunit
MENWKKYKLKELVELKSGYAFKGADFISAGVPVIKIKNVKPGKIVFDNLSYVSREVANKAQNFRILSNDILITMSGNRIEGTPETWVGKVALFKHNGEFLLNQRVGILKVKDTNSVSEVFISLLLSSEGFQYHFISKATSSGGQANISPSLIYGTDVTIPPIEEQKAIAKILSSLDDKIELNRRMNKTLEAIARALFKAWFVDFEPVRANMENRPSESASPEIAKLFPSEFENGIPKDWERKPLIEFFRLIGGGTPKTTNPEYWNGEILWYSVVDAPNESDVFVIDTEKKITQLGLEKSSTKLLRKGLTIISARGTVGKLAITGAEMIMNQSCYAIEGKYGDYFTFYVVKEAITELKQKTHGAVFDTITQDTFKSISQILPKEKVITEFEIKVDPVMRRIESNLRMSKELSEIRDSLLPRLISGKLPVSKIEDKAKGENE